jgi:hypothetical protein
MAKALKATKVTTAKLITPGIMFIKDSTTIFKPGFL